MSVIVVAHVSVKPGHGKDVLDGFRQVAPVVHVEQGCEMYAAHQQVGSDNVVMVERWASAEDLRAHSKGPAMARLTELIGEHLTGAPDVWVCDAVAMGDDIKGVIPG